MGLDDPKRLDIVARAPTGEIVLIMVTTGDWSAEAGMLGQLRAKLQNYIAFTGSGQYEEQFGKVPAKITLLSSCDLTNDAKEMLERASSASGITIDVEKVAAPSIWRDPESEEPQVESGR